jgi:PAS domain S-box-containing protein
MTIPGVEPTGDLVRQLADAKATLHALLSGQVDAVADSRSNTPVLLSKAQEALRESEQQYRQIVETTLDGILKLDREARILFVNRRFADMLGYDARAMVGASIYSFMSEEAQPALVEGLRQREGTRGMIDTMFRHRSGTEISVNISGSPLLDRDGAHSGNLGLVRDVTEQRKLQSQLMVSDRMASIGTLAAGVAHEINNPLAAVIANLEFIADTLAPDAKSLGESTGQGSEGRLREQLTGPVADARDAAERVRVIVRDLKVFSRSPADEARGPVNVEGVMESSLRMAWNEIRHHAVLLKQYDAVPEVEGNEARLGQVFVNLLVNAAQSLATETAERNEVTVRTRLEGARVIIEVGDNGPGIQPAIIARIFDAFFTTKPVGTGTGLGLAICQRIVTDMGGELTVASTVGIGTVFRVALPVVDAEQYRSPAPAMVPLVAASRGRLLVVDDEPAVLRSVSRMLSRDHEVVALNDAREALALCVEGATFDLILCDLMMPHMTGMDLYRELLRVAPQQAERMIFVTGGAFTQAAQRFLADTTRQHVEKPFDFADLRAIVQRHLEANPSPNTPRVLR